MKRSPISYAPYGHRHDLAGAAQCGFNGEYFSSLVSKYFLGNGYRTFSPELMRFCSPDSFSPFIVLNAYGYCGGDPVNHVDPTGHGPDPTALLAKASDRKAKVKDAGRELKIAKSNLNTQVKRLGLLERDVTFERGLAEIDITRTKLQKVYDAQEGVLSWIERKLQGSKYTIHQADLRDMQKMFESAYQGARQQVDNFHINNRAQWRANTANLNIDGHIAHWTARLDDPGLPAAKAIEIRAEIERLTKTRIAAVSLPPVPGNQAYSTMYS